MPYYRKDASPSAKVAFARLRRRLEQLGVLQRIVNACKPACVYDVFAGEPGLENDVARSRAVRTFKRCNVDANTVADLMGVELEEVEEMLVAHKPVRPPPKPKPPKLPKPPKVDHIARALEATRKSVQALLAPKPGRYYSHYKGGLYVVTMLRQDGVHYRSVSGTLDWTCHRERWAEHVEWPDGIVRPRFVPADVSGPVSQQ